MSAEYPAGTVAIATVRGVKGLRVMRTDGVAGGDTIWISVLHVDGWRTHYAEDVTDVRPLVTLDFGGWIPECPASVARWMTKKAEEDRDCPSMSAVLMVAQEITEQTGPPKPPRIDEPGFGVPVVASTTRSDVRRIWIRYSTKAGVTYRWIADGCTPHTWDELVDPTREGLS